MSGIPVFSAGTSLQSSGVSVSAQIPADSAGMLPLFVRVTATAAGYFRLSQDGASASIGDLLIQPSDGLILKTCGLSQFSFVSQSGASTVTVTPIDVGGTKYPTNIFTPAALFTTGVNGAWYDPSDFSTLFQDAAGTTPVTAVGQPVGLMLDKSKGLVLGPELVTNGDFTNGTTGWTASDGTQSVSNSELTITSTGASYPSTQQLISCVVGKTYVLTATVRKGGGASSAGVQINGVGGVYTSSVSNVSLRYQFVASFASYIVAAAINGSAVAGDTATFDNISVRELPGNHAFNPSGNSANFPVLQQDGTGRYYLAFNGVNQWLQTNSIDFTYGDKMFVSAGVRKLSDTPYASIVELSPSSDIINGTFQLATQGATGSNAYRIQDRGTNLGAGYSSVAYLPPTTNVLSASMDMSASAIINLRVNGSGTAIAGGSGVFSSNPLYIGARAGSSYWFNGRLYGLVVAGKAASASEIASTETWLNQKTGAY